MEINTEDQLEKKATNKSGMNTIRGMNPNINININLNLSTSRKNNLQFPQSTSTAKNHLSLFFILL